MWRLYNGGGYWSDTSGNVCGDFQKDVIVFMGNIIIYLTSCPVNTNNWSQHVVLYFLHLYYCLFLGSSFAYHEKNHIHKSSSIEVYYQCGLQQTQANMLLEMFVQIIAEPCFDILRTKEQLGTKCTYMCVLRWYDNQTSNCLCLIDLIFGVLMPLSAIFQLYHGDQF